MYSIILISVGRPRSISSHSPYLNPLLLDNRLLTRWKRLSNWTRNSAISQKSRSDSRREPNEEIQSGKLDESLPESFTSGRLGKTSVEEGSISYHPLTFHCFSFRSVINIKFACNSNCWNSEWRSSIWLSFRQISKIFSGFFPHQ